jgi:hypothetical protein
MIILDIGRRGQGKTTLALFMARRAARRFIFDPRGLVEQTPGDRLKTSSPTTIAQGVDRVVDDQVPEIVITPTLEPQTAFNALINELYEWLKREPKASFTLVIDELRFLPDLETAQFEWLLRCSQPDRVHIILTCHRPADIPVNIRAIADQWLIFRVTQEHDLKVIAERSPRAAAVARHLQKREFVAWDDAEGDYKVFKRPDQWFVPLGQTIRPLDDAEATLGFAADPKDKQGNLLQS